MEGKIYGKLWLARISPVVIKSSLLCRSIILKFFEKATAVNTCTVEALVSEHSQDAKKLSVTGAGVACLPVVQALNQYLGGHGFKSCEGGGDFFFVPC